MTDCDDYKRLADELDGWHDCADGDVAAGNGHFRVVCESDSEQQRLNLRATLREAAETLRAASVKAGEVKVKALEWSEHKGPDGNCCYDHVTASSTIGGYSIEWKGWKDNDSYAVSRDEASVTFEYTLDTAKAAAQADYEARIRSALVVESAPTASVGAMREALQFARDQLVTVCNGSTGGIPNAICALIPEAIDKIDAAIAAANQSDGGECACGKFNDGERCPGPDGQPLCARPSDTLPVPQAVEAVSVDEVFHVIAEWADNEFIETTNSSVEALARALLAKFKMEGR